MQLGPDRSLERCFDPSIKMEFDPNLEIKLETGVLYDDIDFDTNVNLEHHHLNSSKFDVKLESLIKFERSSVGAGSLDLDISADFINAITSDEIDCAEFYPSLGVSPSDDMWCKFEGADHDHDLDALLEEVSRWEAMSGVAGADSQREIRNHDCMWAGLCASEKHERHHKQDHLACPPMLAAPRRICTTADDLSQHHTTTTPSYLRSSPTTVKRKTPGPTSARSILKRRAVTPPAQPMDVKRPDTPLSDNDLDLELPDLLEEIHPLLRSNSATEAMLHQMRVDSEVCSATRKTVSPSTTPVPVTTSQQRRFYPLDSFNTDHCYFQNQPAHIKTEIHTDSLGVQTPSDSEEEIDVETVCSTYETMTVKKPSSRSNSSGAGSLPTTPSFHDRQQLQRTMASAMQCGGKLRSRSSSPLTSVSDPTSASAPTSLSSENCRPVAKRRPGKRGRTPYDECSGKSGKRKRYGRHKNKAKRRRRTYVRSGGGSSDSEVDPTERRSLHNNMERKRRIDLRNSFEHLRLLVPETADNDKAAKVVILGSGAMFCQVLCQEEKLMLLEKAALKRQQERLRHELAQLRRSLASGRR